MIELYILALAWCNQPNMSKIEYNKCKSEHIACITKVYEKVLYTAQDVIECFK